MFVCLANACHQHVVNPLASGEGIGEVIVKGNLDRKEMR